jgi:hypothetical protein
MFWATVPIYMIFGGVEATMYLWFWGESAYVFIFRLECMSDIRSESLYVD